MSLLKKFMTWGIGYITGVAVTLIPDKILALQLLLIGVAVTLLIWAVVEKK